MIGIVVVSHGQLAQELVTAARTIVAPDLAVGDHVEWDGSKYVKSTDPGIGRVTAAAAGYAEVSLAA